MKIGSPVNEPPKTNYGHPPTARPEKYTQVWDAVKALADGEWLPVECRSANAAYQLCAAARANKVLLLRARQQWNMVYLQQLRLPAPPETSK